MLTGPTSATAAEVAFKPGLAFFSGSVLFHAAPGEANDVRVQVTGVDPNTVGVTLSDAGAVISTDASCQLLDPHTVHCPVSGVAPVVDLDLGDGNDRLLTTLQPSGWPSGFTILANGGPGDDVLDVRHGAYAILDGGGGRDQLYGGAFSDYLTDGDRDGAAGAAAPGPDVLDGGGTASMGRAYEDTADVVSYQQRTNAVVVDLGRHLPAGERGEGDVVRRVESVVGGSGPDQLTGTDGPNQISGGVGRDTLTGRGGDDLFGAVHPYTASELTLKLPTGRAGTRGDNVLCGSGSDDVIEEPGKGSYIRPECELLDVPRRVQSQTFTWPAPAYPTPAGGSLSYSFGCATNDEPPGSMVRCPGSVTLREAAGRKRLIASGKFVTTGLGVKAQLQFTPAGRQLASRRHGVRASIGFHGKNLPITSWKIRLKLPH